MKRKKIISVIALLLIVLMLLSLLMSILPVSAFAVTQSEIDELTRQKDEISSQAQEIQERIDSLKEKQANVLEQKAALNEKIRLANEQLQIVAQEIDYYDEIIAEKSKELEEAENREQEQRDRYRARIRAMEENGGYNILALILSSDSFGQLLTAMDDMGEIMASDRALEEQYVAAREETEEIKAQYEAEREEYELHQSELQDERTKLEQETEDAFATLEELEDAIEQAEREYEEACAQEAASAAQIQWFIAQYNAQQQAMQQQQQQAGGTENPDSGWTGDNGDSWTGDNGGDWTGDNGSGGDNSGGGWYGGAQSTGSFVWPVPCSTRITGRFNEPRAGHLHAGIDIDGYGNDGGPILAADAGVVITSSWDNTYGNYVIIDHGNGIQTVYAHNSGNAVSVGDTVYQGQTIAYLGATGNATGTHCHFEIYINGERVDPAGYFTGLTYYQC